MRIKKITGKRKQQLKWRIKILVPNPTNYIFSTMRDIKRAFYNEKLFFCGIKYGTPKRF